LNSTGCYTGDKIGDLKVALASLRRFNRWRPRPDQPDEQGYSVVLNNSRLSSKRAGKLEKIGKKSDPNCSNRFSDIGHAEPDEDAEVIDIPERTGKPQRTYVAKSPRRAPGKNDEIIQGIENAQATREKRTEKKLQSQTRKAEFKARKIRE